MSDRNVTGAARYAPSPSGELHVGNLRTALVAWALARQSGRRFILRVEDIDVERSGAHEVQIRALEELGLDWDGPIQFQSDNLDRYNDILADLQRRDLVFECYCSRREVREAVRAPHTPPSHYPGTCLHLTSAQRREKIESGRPAAIRLRPDASPFSVQDIFHDTYSGPIDAVVLRRGDGAPAYNLAAVVDDSDSGIDQVVRGDDLLEAAPAQAKLTTFLGKPAPTYGHVPLVLGPSGARLAKRDGAVTLSQLKERGWTTGQILGQMAQSLGVLEIQHAQEFLRKFNPAKMPLHPTTFAEANGFYAQ